MAVAVVERLEIVEIEQQAGLMPGPAGAAAALREGALEATPVEDAGQRVGMGEPLELLGALAHGLLEPGRILLDAARHRAEGLRQPADLVAPGIDSDGAELAGTDMAGGMLDAGQPVEHGALEQQGHQGGRRQQDHAEEQAERQEETAVDDAVDIHHRDVEPAEAVEITDADEHALAVDGHEARLHEVVAGSDPGDHLAEQAAVGVVVDDLVDRLLGRNVLGQAVEVDEAGVAMGLHGAAAVDEHALDAGLRDVDDLADELGQVEAGADDAQHAAILADDAVDPDLGDAEIVVVVDVQMAAGAQCRRLVIPAVARIGGRQRVALARVLVAVVLVVEVVIARAGEDGEIAAVPEGLAVMLQLREAALGFLRIVLILGPGDDRGGAGDRLGQRDLAHQRFQPAIAIEQDLLLGDERAELHHGRVDDPEEGRAGRNRDRHQDGEGPAHDPGLQAMRAGQTGFGLAHRVGFLAG